MAKSKPLATTDPIERELLTLLAAQGNQARERVASEALKRSRDRIDDIWNGSPMRMGEARAIAGWLGYELKLIRFQRWREAAAYRDPPPVRARTPQRARRTG